MLEFCSSFDAVQETCGVHCKCERESYWNQMGARAERDGSGRRDARGRTNAGRDVRLSSRVRAGSQTNVGDRSRAPRAQRSGRSARSRSWSGRSTSGPQAPSSAISARASPDGKVRSRTRKERSWMGPEDDENCVGLWQNDTLIVPSRESKHHRTRSMSESSPSSEHRRGREPRSATGHSSRSTLSVRTGGT